MIRLTDAERDEIIDALGHAQDLAGCDEDWDVYEAAINTLKQAESEAENDPV